MNPGHARNPRAIKRCDEGTSANHPGRARIPRANKRCDEGTSANHPGRARILRANKRCDEGTSANSSRLGSTLEACAPRGAFALLLFLLIMPLASAQEPETQPDPPPAPKEGLLTAPVVDYDIDVRLDHEEKKLHGSQVLRYTNTSPDLIGDLVFHTYLNASSNLRSTYYRETVAMDGPVDLGEEPDKRFGYIHISRVNVAGEDLTNMADYITVPDGDPEDRTVWRVPLQGPLMPGETITVTMDFTVKLPYAWDRVGYADDFYMVVQWFPKIAVWESKGVRGAEKAGWNARAFHRFTEFYADFGNYRVAITAPNNFVIGATGVLESKQETETGTRHVYSQARVHDFAWTASPRFEAETFRFEPGEWVTEDEIQGIMRLHGLTREEAVLQPVDINLLMLPEHDDQTRRHFEAACQSLKWFGLWYGRYPYKTLTLVDTPRVPGRGNFAGGMEYPTLIAIGTRSWNAAGDRGLEGLIAHEFGHQYWYGLVGTNEAEEPWLDEGFTTYSASKVMDAAWGPWFPYWNRGVPDNARNLLLPEHIELSEILLLDRFDPHGTLPRVPFSLSEQVGFKTRSNGQRVIQGSLGSWSNDRMRQYGWEFLDYNYWSNSYSKPAAMLYQLESELGAEVMARVMRTWFQEQIYRHPNTDDFIKTVNRVSGRDMKWFFSELMDKAAYVDYAVDNVYSVTSRDDVGYMVGPDGPQPIAGDNATTTRHFVRIRNHGGMHYPVDVAIHFADGTQILERWNGDYIYKQFTYEDKPAIDRVVIDPEGKLVLDRNRANNSWTAEPDKRASRRWSARLLLGVQNILQTLAGGL